MRFAASTAIGPMALALACCGTRVFWQPAGALRWPAAGPSWRGLLAGVNQRQNMCPAAPGSLVQRSETGGHGGHQNRPPAPGRVGVLSLRVREVVRAARVAIRDGTAVYSAQLHCNPAHMAPFGHYLCSNKGAQTIHFHTEVVTFASRSAPWPSSCRSRPASPEKFHEANSAAFLLLIASAATGVLRAH